MPKIHAVSRRPVVLRAIHANRGVEAWYRAQLESLINRMAASVAMHVGVAYRDADHSHGLASDAGTKQYEVIDVKTGGNAGTHSTRANAEKRIARLVSMSNGHMSAAHWKIVETTAPRANPTQQLKTALRVWGNKWQKQFNEASTELSKKFADRSMGATERQMMDALKAAGFTVGFTFTPAMRDAYRATIAEQVGLIRSIPQQYLKDVEGAVWRSVAAGHDMGTLGTELQKTYGISYRRAALISRDQNNKAKAVIENVRRRELGITEAIWMHSGGGVQPRPTHLKAGQDRQRFNLKTGWYDPDEGKNIWPGMLINCRCTSRAIVPGFED